jgi:RhtB (resistance to homoserine/threonine) family protein
VEQLQLLGALLIVDMLAAMSPGPNFVLVTQTAIDRGLRHAAAVVSGFTAANLVWCSAVLLGLSSLFELVPWLYGTIKVLGGLYLVYLGVSLWRVRAPDPVSVADTPRGPLRAAFGAGLLTNLTNPKSAVYFGSIFTLFLGPDTPGWVRAAAVGVVLVDTVLWYGGVAVLFSRPTAQRIYRRVRRRIDRVAGAVLVAFGARLALVRD